MERIHLLAVAAFLACCFGGWACGKSQDDTSSTYYPPYTDTNSNTYTVTKTLTYTDTDSSTHTFTMTATDTQSATGSQTSTSALPGSGGSAGSGGNAVMGGSPGIGGIVSTGGIIGAGGNSVSVQPDAGTDAGTTPGVSGCGNSFQLPCSDGACRNGNRLERVGVLYNTTRKSVLWCIDCNSVAGATYQGTRDCAELGITYTAGSCTYYIPGRGPAASVDLCDGIDNDCSGKIDDGAAACASSGTAAKCVAATNSTAIMDVGGVFISIPTNVCQCTPNCTNKQCGDMDGCDFNCSGPCPSGYTCMGSNGYACVNLNPGTSTGTGSGTATGTHSATSTGTSISTATTPNTATGVSTGTGTGTTCHTQNSCMNFTIGRDSGTGWLIGNATNICSQKIWCMLYPNDGSSAQELTLSPGVTYGEGSGLYWPNATYVQFSCILPTDPFSCFPPG